MVAGLAPFPRDEVGTEYGRFLGGCVDCLDARVDARKRDAQQRPSSRDLFPGSMGRPHGRWITNPLQRNGTMGPGDEPRDDGVCMGRLVMRPLQGEDLVRLSRANERTEAAPGPRARDKTS